MRRLSILVVTMLATTLVTSSWSCLPPLSASDHPKVFAYYYPWYKNITSWIDVYTVHPLIGDYYFTAESVAWDIEQAKMYDIDGFAIEFYGSFDEALSRYEMVFRIAERMGFTLTFLIDPIAIFDYTDRTIPRPAPLTTHVMESFLKQISIIPKFYESPAFLRRSGKPVTYMYALGAGGSFTYDAEKWEPFWSRVKQVLGEDTFYIGDFGSSADLNELFRTAGPFDAIALYTPIDVNQLMRNPAYSPEDILRRLISIEDRLYCFAYMTGKEFYPLVLNGFNSYKKNPEWHQPGVSSEIYRRSWEVAGGFKPETIFCLSWNEVMEGNAVLPSKEHGTLYLEITMYQKQSLQDGKVRAILPCSMVFLLVPIIIASVFVFYVIRASRKRSRKMRRQ